MHRMEEAVLELEPYDGSTRLKGPGAATLVDKQIALVEASTTAPGRSCESWSSRYLYCWCFGALVMLVYRNTGVRRESYRRCGMVLRRRIILISGSMEQRLDPSSNSMTETREQ